MLFTRKISNPENWKDYCVPCSKEHYFEDCAQLKERTKNTDNRTVYGVPGVWRQTLSWQPVDGSSPAVSTCLSTADKMDLLKVCPSLTRNIHYPPTSTSGLYVWLELCAVWRAMDESRAVQVFILCQTQQWKCQDKAKHDPRTWHENNRIVKIQERGF